MKVYLDMCSIQRPLDSQDDVRVATEVTQFGTGLGDYTRERDTILRGLTMDEIWSEIERTHRRRPHKPPRKKRARG